MTIKQILLLADSVACYESLMPGCAAVAREQCRSQWRRGKARQGLFEGKTLLQLPRALAVVRAQFKSHKPILFCETLDFNVKWGQYIVELHLVVL
jgi:hypothetical protein